MKRRNLFSEIHTFIGATYGRLTVMATTRHLGDLKALVKCTCGTVKLVRLKALTRAKPTQSCGCLHKESVRASNSTHGQSWGMKRSAEMTIHHNMMNRCYNSQSSRFSSYGARGIKVCERWHKFENFLEDMGHRPEGLSLDRVDVNGDYSKENCKWATRAAQANNKTTTRWLTYQGETLSMKDWCQKLNLPYGRTQARLNLGWSVEEAFEVSKQKAKGWR